MVGMGWGTDGVAITRQPFTDPPAAATRQLAEKPRLASREKQKELLGAMLTTLEGQPGPVTLYSERRKTGRRARARLLG